MKSSTVWFVVIPTRRWCRSSWGLFTPMQSLARWCNQL